MSTNPRAVRFIIGLALLSGTLPPVQAPDPPDPRFGAVEAYMLPEQADRLRVGWDRMIIHWDRRQPGGPDDWIVPAPEAEWLAEAAGAGREVVALLMGTPAWATDGAPIAGVPRGLYQPVDDPGNLWAGFVRRVVGEHKGRIRHWIIWNEPDITMDHPGAQFEGTVDDYYHLLKVAYLAAKEVDPHAVVHLAGLTFWHDVENYRPPYLQRLLDVARQDPTAARHDYYFDVLTVHIYFTTDSVFDIIALYRKILLRYGLRKPIWLNETNAAPMDDPQYPWVRPMLSLTMDQQAAFIVQAHAMALAAGASRIAVYKLYDSVGPIPGGESYGLFRPDGSARPAAEAYGLVTAHFAGTRRVTHLSHRLYHLVTLQREAAVTRVMWARRAYPVALRLRPTPQAAGAILYDQAGNAYPLEVDAGGSYRLTLPAAECETQHGCIIGGSPLIIVETLAPTE